MKLIEKTYLFEQEKDYIIQMLTMQTQDGGGGNYVVISTERWAIDRDDIDKFCAQLKSVLEGME